MNDTTTQLAEDLFIRAFAANSNANVPKLFEACIDAAETFDRLLEEHNAAEKAEKTAPPAAKRKVTRSKR